MQKGPATAMKLKFKVQPYQTAAVDAVVDCFAGQPFSSGPTYRIDPGKRMHVNRRPNGTHYRRAKGDHLAALHLG